MSGVPLRLQSRRWCVCWDVEVDPDGNEGQWEAGLGVVLKVRPRNTRLVHPLAVYSLHVDGLCCLLADLVAWIALAGAVVASQAAQAGRAASVVVVIVVEIIVAVFGIVYGNGAALRCASMRVRRLGTGQDGGQQ